MDARTLYEFTEVPYFPDFHKRKYRKEENYIYEYRTKVRIKCAETWYYIILSQKQISIDDIPLEENDLFKELKNNAYGIMQNTLILGDNSPLKLDPLQISEEERLKGR